MRTPHEILGIKEEATEEQIRKAYRALAKRYHPDRNPGNEKAAEKFKEVQEAYDTLTGKGTSPDNELGQLYTDVSSLFLACLTQICRFHQDPTTIDIVDVMVRSIEDTKRRLHSAIKDNEKAMRPLKRMQGRFKVKSDYNIYEEVIKKNIRETEEAIANIQKELEMISKVEQYVKDTEFTKEGGAKMTAFYFLETLK